MLGHFEGTCILGPLTLNTSTPNGEYFLARLNSTVTATLSARLEPLALYPNPATTKLHLSVLLAGTRVQLVDALGRVVCETAVSDAAQVSVRGLAPGLYTVRATDAKGQQYTGRVVVE